MPCLPVPPCGTLVNVKPSSPLLQAALQAHGKTDYFKAAGKKQAPLFGGPPALKIFSPIGPSGAFVTARR